MGLAKIPFELQFKLKCHGNRFIKKKIENGLRIIKLIFKCTEKMNLSLM